MAGTCPFLEAADQAVRQFLTRRRNKIFSAENSFVAANSRSGFGLTANAARSEGIACTLVSEFDIDGDQVSVTSIESCGLDLEWNELVYPESPFDSNDPFLRESRLFDQASNIGINMVTNCMIMIPGANHIGGTQRMLTGLN